MCLTRRVSWHLTIPPARQLRSDWFVTPSRRSLPLLQWWLVCCGILTRADVRLRMSVLSCMTVLWATLPSGSRTGEPRDLTIQPAAAAAMEASIKRLWLQWGHGYERPGRSAAWDPASAPAESPIPALTPLPRVSKAVHPPPGAVFHNPPHHNWQRMLMPQGIQHQLRLHRSSQTGQQHQAG